MAVMFAGLGLVQGVPSFMPVASADFSVTDGTLTVSSEFIQGAAILEIVVNDPNISSTDDDINDGATIDIGGNEFIMNQAVNGKWYVYVVDDSVSTLMDADGTGLEFGVHCDTGIGVGTSSTGGSSANVIADSSTHEIWAEALATSDEATDEAGSCFDLNGMIGSLDTNAGSTVRQLLSAAVLTDAPTLSDHDDAGTDLGQRSHALNASGYGSWPYIVALELNSDNIIEYGDDSVNVEFGNTDDEAAIGLINPNPGDLAQVHLTITDPALNIDPTAADLWLFDLDSPLGTASTKWAKNGTGNDALTAAELGEMGCVDNCNLVSDATGVLSGFDDVVMTESSANSGFFESFDLNGSSELTTTLHAAADTKIVFEYAGETVDMIITYNDATISMETDGDWDPVEVATITIVDPDMNRNPLSDETLSIGDETAKIPTI